MWNIVITKSTEIQYQKIMEFPTKNQKNSKYASGTKLLSLDEESTSEQDLYISINSTTVKKTTVFT